MSQSLALLLLLWAGVSRAVLNLPQVRPDVFGVRQHLDASQDFTAAKERSSQTKRQQSRFLNQGTQSETAPSLPSPVRIAR